MKTFFLFLLTLLAAAGIYIGLLYSHIVPAAPLAQSSQLAAVALEGVGLYSPPNAAAKSEAADPTPSAERRSEPDEGERTVDNLRSSFNHKKASLLRHLAKHAPKREIAPPVPEGPISPKLAAIYDTMKPADVARIFDKQPDSEVARALVSMDEDKAGKILAAMSNERAARITAVLARPDSSSSSTADQ